MPIITYQETTSVPAGGNFWKNPFFSSSGADLGEGLRLIVPEEDGEQHLALLGRRVRRLAAGGVSTSRRQRRGRARSRGCMRGG
jgi:hypothetical protein